MLHAVQIKHTVATDGLRGCEVHASKYYPRYAIHPQQACGSERSASIGTTVRRRGTFTKFLSFAVPSIVRLELVDIRWSVCILEFLQSENTYSLATGPMVINNTARTRYESQ